MILRSCIAVAITVIALALPAAAGATAKCPISYGSADDAKPNKIYLYYPTVADPTFPEFGAVGGGPTSPAVPFDITQLPSYTGTVAALKNRINDVVTDDFCEFNAQMIPTTSMPSTPARRAVVAIGTDSEPAGRWGRTDVVDTADALAVGNARVWAGTYQNSAGFPGGALEGSNSTTTRWGNAIGGTAAHEAGHTYGLVHNTTTLPGEDAFGRHLMPAGSDVTQEERAGYRRHFSDTEFSTLAANIGLSIQTMHNWDLVNPNATTGHRFRLTFLSTQPSMLMTWSYAGSRTPWIDPTVSPFGTQSFHGTTYNRYRLTWQTADPWSGGAPGEVPGGGEFHVGATFSGVNFNQPDPIIITNSELLDGSGDPLPLKPRLPGYDSGTINLVDGAFELAFEAAFVNPADPPMLIRNVVVRELPRVMSIGSMMRGKSMRDPFREPFRPWGNSTRLVLDESRPLTRERSRLKVEVARLGQARHILEASGRDCAASDAPAGLDDAASCRSGFNADLFPATTMYLTADAVTPDAKVWNPRLKQFERTDLVSRIYYQFGGRRIDLNKNGMDDAIDIAFFKAPDRNGDGVIDDFQR
ncbi:MAG TPA: hypothetical protein VK486_11725 [Thermoleophilaceae bacterium]|nr:hypothetical protein [Thermoleophilaceae bacterium]